MTATRDVVVVGGGAMGSAAAWHLARRGREVTLLERYGERHAMGASHGRSRNFNLAAYLDPLHQGMLTEAATLWRELEAESGAALLDLVGIVTHGAGVRPDVDEALRALGVRAELVPLGEARERWRGIRPDTRVLHTPEGGRVDAEEAVAALQAMTARHGGEVLLETPVEFVGVRDDGRVEVDTATETYVAERVVVTVGAWTEQLLGSFVALPSMVVTQQQPAHFAVADPLAAWPGFVHEPAPGDPRYDGWPGLVYGMLSPGEGVKAGWHGAGPVVDPDRRSFQPDPHVQAALQRYARTWLPGVDADALDPISCTYTTTADHAFVVDAVGPVVVGAGFSGHGFKFVPTVGRMLADLATDAGGRHPEFALSR